MIGQQAVQQGLRDLPLPRPRHLLLLGSLVQEGGGEGQVCGRLQSRVLPRDGGQVAQLARGVRGIGPFAAKKNPNKKKKTQKKPKKPMHPNPPNPSLHSASSKGRRRRP